MTIQSDVLDDIAKERDRQDKKWGKQTHADVDRDLTHRRGGCDAYRMAEEYEIPSAPRAKNNCETRARQDKCTFGHILVEEVAEAIEAATELQCQLAVNGDRESLIGDRNIALQKELIQVAAVCVQWVEFLRERREKAKAKK